MAPRGATSVTVNGSYDIDSRDAEDFSGSLGFPASPLECKCDLRTSIDATAAFDITGTALSTHNTTQPKFETARRAPFLSPTLAIGSPEQQAASSNEAARTLASEQTDDQPVPFERHTSWPSLSLATGVQHAESCTIDICGRSRIHLIPNARHAPPSIFSIDVDSSIAAALDVDGVEPTASRPSYTHAGQPNLSLVTGVQHAEPSTIKNSGRPSLSLTPDTQHVPPVSTGIHFDSWFSRLSLSLVSEVQHAERSVIISGQHSLSLTTGTQHASRSITIIHVDGSHDSTLEVGGVPPMAHTHPQNGRLCFV